VELGLTLRMLLTASSSQLPRADRETISLCPQTKTRLFPVDVANEFMMKVGASWVKGCSRWNSRATARDRRGGRAGRGCLGERASSGACPGYRKDHVVPLSCDGPDTVSNLAMADDEKANHANQRDRTACLDRGGRLRRHNGLTLSASIAAVGRPNGWVAPPGLAPCVAAG
jgi:hypothetical protein